MPTSPKSPILPLEGDRTPPIGNPQPAAGSEEFHVAVGEQVSFSKTVGEVDIYLFAGITGDFSGNHVDEEYMRRSAYGGRIAHGALMVGFMSTCSTMMIDRSVRKGIDETPVSLGYDHVRFLKPVHIGDTVTVRYTITSIEPERRRSRAAIEIRNQRQELVAVAEHILKWVPHGQEAAS
jgi:3-hydroxybutyryl-CoA dehydratase